uniref:Uncharacterized protein n=1 Tax=Rhizophora mucronata TaxID=61149 RepID=A0A2P2KT46_RHIMU
MGNSTHTHTQHKREKINRAKVKRGRSASNGSRVQKGTIGGCCHSRNRIRIRNSLPRSCAALVPNTASPQQLLQNWHIFTPSHGFPVPKERSSNKKNETRKINVKYYNETNKNKKKRTFQFVLFLIFR